MSFYMTKGPLPRWLNCIEWQYNHEDAFKRESGGSDREWKCKGGDRGQREKMLCCWFQRSQGGFQKLEEARRQIFPRAAKRNAALQTHVRPPASQLEGSWACFKPLSLWEFAPATIADSYRPPLPSVISVRPSFELPLEIRNVNIYLKWNRENVFITQKVDQELMSL